MKFYMQDDAPSTDGGEETTTKEEPTENGTEEGDANESESPMGV